MNRENEFDKLVESEKSSIDCLENGIYQKENLGQNDGCLDSKKMNFSKEFRDEDSLSHSINGGGLEDDIDELFDEDFDREEDAVYYGGYQVENTDELMSSIEDTTSSIEDTQEIESEKSDGTSGSDNDWGEDYEAELERLMKEGSEVKTVESDKVSRSEGSKGNKEYAQDNAEYTQGSLKSKLKALFLKVKTRGKIAFKQSVAEDLNITSGRECELYILVEEYKDGIESYIADRGLKAHIYSRLDEIELALLSEDRPMRLVVIETAKGVFSNIKMRGRLEQIIGICNTKERMATVYFSDPVIKGKRIKNAPYISWRTYKSTLDCLEHTKEYGEVYGEPQGVSYRAKVDILDKIAAPMNMESIPMKLREVAMDFNGDTIRKYKVKY